MKNIEHTLPIVSVLVLTLPQAKDRQLRIKTLLDEANIPFEFYYGVDGRIDINPIEKIHNAKLRMKVKGAPLSPGQLGCYASHYNIWKLCVFTQTPCVVLEDDVTFDALLFTHFLNNVPTLPIEAGCIRLFENKARNHKAFPYSTHDGFDLQRFIKGPMSAMGYYLTPQAARKYLDSAAPVFLPVDIYMDRYWVNDVFCGGINPAFVFHDNGFESMIGYEQKAARRPLWVTVMREMFALSERLRRYLYNRGFK